MTPDPFEYFMNERTDWFPTGTLQVFMEGGPIIEALKEFGVPIKYWLHSPKPVERGRSWDTPYYFNPEEQYSIVRATWMPSEEAEHNAELLKTFRDRGILYFLENNRKAKKARKEKLVCLWLYEPDVHRHRFISRREATLTLRQEYDLGQPPHDHIPEISVLAGMDHSEWEKFEARGPRSDFIMPYPGDLS